MEGGLPQQPVSGLPSPNSYHSTGETAFPVIPTLSDAMEGFFAENLLVENLFAGNPTLSSRDYGLGFVGRSMDARGQQFPFQLPGLPPVPPVSWDETPPQEGDTADDVPPADTPPDQGGDGAGDGDAGGDGGDGFVGGGGGPPIIIIIDDDDDDEETSSSSSGGSSSSSSISESGPSIEFP